MGRAHETIQKACAERGAALLGVLNVTPDSFFDGGRYIDVKSAAARVDTLLEQGADLLEIGAESSRPGSEPVPAAEQLRRAMPVLEYALGRGAIVSIDTTSPEVAETTLRAGAHIVNDVSCLGNEALAQVAATFGAPLILMHSRGSMSQERFSEYPDKAYGDVVRDVTAEWEKAQERAVALGIAGANLWFDPGLGFHKNAQQSFEILARLGEFTGLAPVMVVGASRKSFLGSVDGSTPQMRLGASIAAALEALKRGAQVIRVHDVYETRQALLLAAKVGRNTARQSHA
jgi:dihydropteroate synthase